MFFLIWPYNIIVKVLDNATSSVDKIFFGNHAIQKECRAFRVKILNESIKEAFRSKSFLERCQKRHELELHRVDRNIFAWMKTACKNIFEDTYYSARQRVEHKFNVLKAQLNSRDNTNEEGDGGRSDQSRDEESTTKRVKNLSSFPVPSSVISVLSKGPKFAMTAEIKDSTMREVEAGVERLAYGKRWKDFLRRNKEASNILPALPAPPLNAQADEPEGEGQVERTERKNGRFTQNFPDVVKRQPPPSSTQTEEGLKALKKQILNTCKHHSQATVNIMEEERAGLKELKLNENVIVKPSD